MPKYVIEPEIPRAGKPSAQELQAISQKSCAVLGILGKQIQWHAFELAVQRRPTNPQASRCG